MAECKDCRKNVTCIDRRFFGGNQKNCKQFIDRNKYVEVVRCKDCAVPHNKWLGCPKLRGLVPPPDFYCAFGERRDGE